MYSLATGQRCQETTLETNRLRQFRRQYNRYMLRSPLEMPQVWCKLGSLGLDMPVTFLDTFRFTRTSSQHIL
jgi:hypothetical protein